MRPVVRFTVQCDGAKACLVSFEPEGAQVELAPGDSFTVETSGGAPPAEPEIYYDPEGITVWAWSGAETAAWDRRGTRLDI